MIRVHSLLKDELKRLRAGLRRWVSQKKPPWPALQLWELEDRVMYSASPVAGMLVEPDAIDVQATDAEGFEALVSLAEHDPATASASNEPNTADAGECVIRDQFDGDPAQCP